MRRAAWEGPACHLTDATALSPVTQLQVTLASVQELLIEQQQKVQELAHELATAKVLVPEPLVPAGLPCMALHACPLSPVHCVPRGLILFFLMLGTLWELTLPS